MHEEEENNFAPNFLPFPIFLKVICRRLYMVYNKSIIYALLMKNSNQYVRKEQIWAIWFRGRFTGFMEWWAGELVEQGDNSCWQDFVLKQTIICEIATTQPTTQNNLKQLLLVWYYYRLKKTTTPHHTTTPHRDWLHLKQF